MPESDIDRRRVQRARTERARVRPAPEAAAALSSVYRPIHDAVRPCLVEIAYLGRRARKPPIDVTFDHVRVHLGKAKERLEKLSLAPEDVRDIYYALVAFIDEVMQADPGPLQEFWEAHLLQLEIFGETRAGEGFFERLESAQQNGRLGVLWVYHVCLLFGFHGVYGRHGELERENLIEVVAHALGEGARPQPLAPFGKRPEEPYADRERNRLLQALAGIAAVTSVVWYLGLLFAVDAQARMLEEQLQRAREDVGSGVTSTLDRG
jgi:type IV/VI secretion system ImpK/VasF family protein